MRRCRNNWFQASHAATLASVVIALPVSSQVRSHELRNLNTYDQSRCNDSKGFYLLQGLSRAIHFAKGHFWIAQWFLPPL